MNLKDLLDKMDDFEVVSVWFGKEHFDSLTNLIIQGRGTYYVDTLKKELYPDDRDSGAFKVVRIWPGLNRTIAIQIRRNEYES